MDLFTTAVRCLNSRESKIVRCPQKGRAKLITTALGVYIKNNYQSVADGCQNTMKVVSILRENFAKLSKDDVSKYNEIAKQNKKAVKRRDAIFRDASVRPYSLFMKEKFNEVANNFSGARQNNFSRIAKTVSREWKALDQASREVYIAKAARIREAAFPKRNAMIKIYKGNN